MKCAYMGVASNNKAPLPYVIANMAMSADGKIATANREIHSFGSKHDLDNLYRLRARADAVICGARTAEMDGVTMGTGGEKYRRLRLKNNLSPCHLRIIVSGSGSINTEAHVFKSRISPIIIITKESLKLDVLKNLKSVADDVLCSGDVEVDFFKAFRCLKEKWNVNVLVCEGGGELNSALFKSDLIDELYITICPYIFGGEDAPTIADGVGIKTLAAAVRLVLVSRKLVGNEIFLRFKIIKKLA